MDINLGFRRQAFSSLIGGVSSLDLPKLSVEGSDQAQDFIAAYGYDIDSEEDVKVLKDYHLRAVTFMKEFLMEKGDEMPDAITGPAVLENLSQLLLYASSRNGENQNLQKWSCAVLKVMHTMVHLEHDMYSIYSSEIQSQILDPIQKCIYSDPVKASQTLQGNGDSIPLHKYEEKKSKDFNSSVIKLLAKKKLVALNLLDKVGIRFVTKSTFDTFRVMRFLIDNGLVSFPHSIVDESVNTVYPTNLFFEVVDQLRSKREIVGTQDLDEILDKKIEEHMDRAEWRKKDNQFSAKDYRFIKFINRKLIRVKSESREFKFFFPFEVQIMDYETYVKNMRGPLSHQEYKARQTKGARRRLLGFDSKA